MIKIINKTSLLKNYLQPNEKKLIYSYKYT